eukprot:6196926-Ditylum_brightwellii.AAC.1
MVHSLAPVRGSRRTSNHARSDIRTKRVGSIGLVPSDKRLIGKSDMDTHEDTCVAGATHKVLERTGKFCEIYPYSEDCKPKIVKALDIPGQEPSLICPNQLRDNGLNVNNCPKQYHKDSSHYIDVMNLDMELPLLIHG